jgi:hypothetical protein
MLKDHGATGILVNCLRFCFKCLSCFASEHAVSFTVKIHVCDSATTLWWLLYNVYICQNTSKCTILKECILSCTNYTTVKRNEHILG